VQLAIGTAAGTGTDEIDVSWPTVSLTPGNTYFLVFTSSDVSLCVGGDTGNSYSGGNAFANPGFPSFPNFDFTFRTFSCGSGEEFTPVLEINQSVNNTCMASFGQVDLAQSFTAVSSTSCGAGLTFTTNTTSTVSISLWTNLPNAGGVQLAIGTAAGTGTDEIDVSWPSVSLTPGNTYFLVFTSTDLSLCVGGDTGNSYAGGNAFANPGFPSFPNFDFTFRTFSCSTPSGFEISWSGPNIISDENTLSPTVAPTENTTYTLTVTDLSTGCSLIDSVEVIVTPLITGIDEVSACDSFLWIDGNTYTENNNTATFNIVGGAANGCDSLVTLNLIITGVTDDCGECIAGGDSNPDWNQSCADCNGVLNGTAFLDNCNVCVGGNTGLEPCDEVAPPVNNDCANATPITPVSPNVNYGMGLYAQANAIGTLWGATASGSGSCGAGTDVFYSLNVPYLNHYIVSVNPFGGADVALEILDACGGSQLSCTDAAGAAGLETAYLISLAAGDYTIRVSGSAASSSVGQFLLNVQAAPTTRIMDGTGCNESDLQLEDVIRCNLVSTALDYEWRFVEVGGGLDASFMRSSLSNAGSTNNRNLRLSWVPGIDYNKLYNVYVRAQFDIPGYGVVWGAYREFATDLTMLGASECTVETGTSVTPTQLRPEYSPNNPVSGLPHTFCNGLVATWVGQAEQFQWELDGPTFHEVTSPSYFVNLGSIAGLQAGQVYQVRVRARVNGLWGSYGVQLPVSIGLPSNTQVLGYLCGTTRALNQAIAAVNTCGASSYTFRFQHATEAERIIVRPAYTCPLWLVTPALTPGETYSVTVKVAQGGVDGDYSTACDITIAGPQAEGLADDMMVSKVATEGAMGIYPNPNTGSEVRVELNGIEDGAHNVEVTIYDIYGKLMTRDVFGHQGSQLSRLVRFETELATGMYLVHVTIDGNIFATEKMVVQ
jgi:hypothetical protein